MAVEISINKAANYFVVKVSGDTDAPTVANAYAAGIASEDYQTNMNALWDISGARLAQFSMAEVRELTRLIGQHSEQRGADYKVAVATQNKGDYHLLRVYSTFIRLAGSFRIKVVSDPQAALEWITTDD